MKHRPNVKMPRLRVGQDTTDWAEELAQAVEQSLNDIWEDLSKGTETHRELTVVPSVDNLETGEIVFYKDGSPIHKLYVKLHGVLHGINLSHNP